MTRKQTQRELITNLLKRRPWLTSAQIARHIGVTSNAASGTLNRVETSGQFIFDNRCRPWRWALAGEKTPCPDTDPPKDGPSVAERMGLEVRQVGDITVSLPPMPKLSVDLNGGNTDA